MAFFIKNTFFTCTCGQWSKEPCTQQCPDDCRYRNPDGEHVHPPGQSSCCSCHCDGGEEDDEEEEEEEEEELPEWELPDWELPGLGALPALPDLPDFGWDPPLPDGVAFNAPEVDFKVPGVVIPERIREGFMELTAGFEQYLAPFKGLYKFRAGTMDKICVFNPIEQFGDFELPRFEACLDFNELAQQAWVPLLRNMLLFMLVWMLLGSVIVVLRQY